ncbi:MAG: cupin domain-containing protein [SAR202 cluster bacterium]|nr:cupin domain-containing protein [SAR202 cluster bacterium]
MAGVVRHWSEQDTASSHNTVGRNIFAERKDQTQPPAGEKRVVLGAGGLHAFHYLMLAPGMQQPPREREDKEHIIYIVSGHGKVSLDGEVTDVGPGDSIYVPPKCRHFLINDGTDLLVHTLVTGMVKQ